MKTAQHTCVYCGKSFYQKNKYDIHYIGCQLTNMTQKDWKTETDCSTTTLTTKELTNITMALALKCKKLEEKVDFLCQALNQATTLNANKDDNLEEETKPILEPDFILQEMSDLMQLKEDDIEYLLKHSFFDTFEMIVTRNIQCKKKQVPLSILKNKMMLMYDFKDKETKNSKTYIWQPLDLKTLQVFINRFHMKLCKYFYDWCQRQNLENVNNEDNKQDQIDKTLVKIMDIETQSELVIKQVKKILCKILANS